MYVHKNNLRSTKQQEIVAENKECTQKQRENSQTLEKEILLVSERKGEGRHTYECVKEAETQPP